MCTLRIEIRVQIAFCSAPNQNTGCLSAFTFNTQAPVWEKSRKGTHILQASEAPSVFIRELEFRESRPLLRHWLDQRTVYHTLSEVYMVELGSDKTSSLMGSPSIILRSGQQAVVALDHLHQGYPRSFALTKWSP